MLYGTVAKVVAPPSGPRQHGDTLVGENQESPKILMGRFRNNHFHLVLQPTPGQNVSLILQSLTVAHTRHYHKDRGTWGHVWQGRFKSPVIEEDEHLLTVMRYVEAQSAAGRHGCGSGKLCLVELCHARSGQERGPAC